MTRREKCHRWVEQADGGEKCALCPAVCRRDRRGKVVAFDACLPPPEPPRWRRDRPKKIAPVTGRTSHGDAQPSAGPRRADGGR